MNLLGTRPAVSDARLRQLVLDLAASPQTWLHLVRYDPARRWYRRLPWAGDQEVWLLSWLPGQYTGFHDHGRSAGAFTVVEGCLRERAAPRGRPDPAGAALLRGSARSFRPVVHPRCDERHGPASRQHSRLFAAAHHDAPVRCQRGPAGPCRGRDGRAVVRGVGRPIGTLVDLARQRLRRLGPAEAFEAVRGGALLVDIRPQTQRAAEGLVPGALHVERNVLEWRFDPASEARLPQATGYDQHVIVMCSQGYASNLAAASLHDIGLVNATDLAGGFLAWARAGLPCQPETAPPAAG
jgi:rhodanese-related sulfurtransferase